MIRVQPDGTVRVTVPRWGSKRQAQDFADQQRAWIERQRRRAEQRRLEARPELPPDTVNALRLQAHAQLPDQLRRLADINGLRVSRVSVRNQRWRWGSCSPNGHICLNWRLVLMPDFVREYVLIHELMQDRKSVV